MSKTVSTSTSTPRPAATVVVLRDGPDGPEVFMVRRHEGTAFMGGAHVFPGGRVDAADREGVEEAVAYHIAAARELFEEAGVLLARDENGRFVSLAGAETHERFKIYRHEIHAGTRPLRAVLEQERLRLALDALVPFAHWVTPAIEPRRYDTRFFVVRVPAEQTPAHDEMETTASLWLTARAALDKCRHDEIVLPPPTWTTLREIEPFKSVDEVLVWARARRIVRREPAFAEEGGEKMLLLPDEPSLLETRFVLSNGRWRAEPART